MNIKVEIGPVIFESNVDDLPKILHVLTNGQNQCLVDAHTLHVRARKAEAEEDITEHNVCIQYADQEEDCYDAAERWKSFISDAIIASLKEESE